MGRCSSRRRLKGSLRFVQTFECAHFSQSGRALLSKNLLAVIFLPGNSFQGEKRATCSDLEQFGRHTTSFHSECALLHKCQLVGSFRRKAKFCIRKGCLTWPLSCFGLMLKSFFELDLFSWIVLIYGKAVLKITCPLKIILLFRHHWAPEMKALHLHRAGEPLHRKDCTYKVSPRGKTILGMKANTITRLQQPIFFPAFSHWCTVVQPTTDMCKKTHPCVTYTWKRCLASAKAVTETNEVAKLAELGMRRGNVTFPGFL